MESRYFERLIDLIHANDSPYNEYFSLLGVLDSREFYYTLANDRDRARDALALRESLNSDRKGKPTVLETMIAMAKRCEDDVVGGGERIDRTAEWFWEMVDNMGLSDQNDDNFNGIIVNKRITNMLDRKYDRHGKYGLFYVKFPPKDLRDVSLWYQMNWHVSEIIIGDDKEIRKISRKISTS